MDVVSTKMKRSLKVKWYLAYHDRGMGHGDWGVRMGKNPAQDWDNLIKCPCRGIANYIVNLHNNSLKK